MHRRLADEYQWLWFGTLQLQHLLFCTKNVKAGIKNCLYNRPRNNNSLDENVAHTNPVSSNSWQMFSAMSIVYAFLMCTSSFISLWPHFPVIKFCTFINTCQKRECHFSFHENSITEYRVIHAITWKTWYISMCLLAHACLSGAWVKFSQAEK